MMLPTRRLLLGAAAALAGTIIAGHPAGAADKLKVVASFSILGDMVKEIGGDGVEVITLVGPDGDAHVYEPTPADAKALAGADLLVVNGLDFEGWLPRLVKASGFSGASVTASNGIAPLKWDEGDHEHEEGHDHEAESSDHDEDHEEGHHHHGDLDPHAWQSLENGIIYVRNIAEALSKADAANAAAYEANADAYAARLEALNEKLKKDFDRLPDDHRTVVTSHDAFQYFGKAYGVTFIAPEGISTESEASAGDVARIVDQIREDHISAVFVENITDPRLIEQIARETGAKVGGELYSDALSGPDGPAPTYVKMFEHNASELLGALAGS